jgi:hypothetical protein
MEVLSRGKLDQGGFILCKVYAIARFAIPFGRRVSRLSVWPGFGKNKTDCHKDGKLFCFGRVGIQPCQFVSFELMLSLLRHCG